ncbi:MAG: hypothetical protein PHG66_06850 [Candidatus Colwellbacteria bacterium]|nr:hypothetical protein [Candidatus Colwellbacteria bacterium]
MSKLIVKSVALTEEEMKKQGLVYDGFYVVVKTGEYSYYYKESPKKRSCYSNGRATRNIRGEPDDGWDKGYPMMTEEQELEYSKTHEY